jgi:AraC family ethanolamine operon transcriptional activator
VLNGSIHFAQKHKPGLSKGIRMPRPIATVSLTSFSSEQLRETVRGSDFEHRQLSDGPFRAHLLRCQFGDSALDAGIYSQDLLVSGTFPAGRIILGYILSGREAGYFNGLRLAVHDVVVIGEGGAMEPYRLPAGTRWVAFQTRREFLEREGIPVPAPSRVVRYSGLSPEAVQLGQCLKALVAPAHTHRPTSTLCMPGDGLVLEDELIAAFRRTIDASQDSKPDAHRPRHGDCARILREVEEFLEHNLSSEIRIGDLCARIGTSRRTLEYLFKDYYGLSPRRYLTVRRLNAVRDRLLRAEPEDVSIGSVASRFGFQHAGRFSQTYRGLFGELPSRTLAGRPGSSGTALRTPAMKRAP